MEHKTVSLADQIFEQLERNILTGTYARGEVFTEMHLSEQLGVSRTPIREALRRLEQEHLIEVSTKGAVIIGISKKDICDMYEIRIRTEGLASKWAAEVITEEGKKELCDIVELQEFYTEKGDPDNIKNMDSKFHETVYRLSGSTALYDTLHPLHKKVIKYRKASVQNTGRALQSVKEHRAICDAIVAGNADLAELLTIQHIKNARDNIEKAAKSDMLKNNQITDHTEYFDIFYREHNGIDLKIAVTAKKADSKTVIRLSPGEIAWDKLYPAGMNTPAVDREIICRPSELLEKDKLCILVIRGKPGTIKGLDEGIFSSWNNSFENAQKNKLYVICEKEFQTLL